MDAMTPDEILLTIRNRAPYLWVDDVVVLQPPEIETRKFIAPDLPLFTGHYPDFPVFPAALQCECAYQASAILIAAMGVSTESQVPVVARSSNQKFRRMVRPGDTLDVKVRLVERVQKAFYLQASIHSDNKLVATLDFTTTVAPLPVDSLSP
jgi:3-hydroxyacyl-[acyl-carrier-protein] dehydratase